MVDTRIKPESCRSWTAEWYCSDDFLSFLGMSLVGIQCYLLSAVPNFLDGRCSPARRSGLGAGAAELSASALCEVPTDRFRAHEGNACTGATLEDCNSRGCSAAGNVVDRIKVECVACTHSA